MDEAEAVLTEVLHCERYALYLDRDAPVPAGALQKVASVLKRRILGEPLQYILGTQEFMGFKFRVGLRVFIPRPETEILVETVLRYASGLKPHAPRLNVVDVGTGSGCIAITLAKLLPCAQVTAIDISSAALEVARDNAGLHGVKINFIQSDLFSTCGLRPAPYDIMVSNPPYIPTGEIETLQPEVRWEPGIALDGGEDGLRFYREIIAQAPVLLGPGAFLIMEMGCGQAGPIAGIIEKHAAFTIKEVVRDYQNIKRVIVAEKNSRYVTHQERAYG